MIIPHGDTHFKQKDWDNYQLEQYKTALKYCDDFRVAIDIGAHIGIHTHRMCEDFGWVYAYEARYGEYLNKNLEGYRNYQHLPFLLGDTHGLANLTDNPGNSGGVSVCKGTDYQMLTLDDWQFEAVDFVKIDVEGWEYHVLKGGVSTILDHRPVIMIEIEKREPTREHTLKLLKKWGYTLEFKKNADHVFR